MTPVDDAPDAGWSITRVDGVATIQLLRDLDAEDAFPLRNALAAEAEGAASLVFDVTTTLYIAHSAQVVIREECKVRTVALRGITDRLRRVLRTDSVQLLDAVIEEPAA